MTNRNLVQLRDDQRGTTIIEFAIVVPVMLLLIMGLCELSYQLYMQSVLTGAMQKAGRDGTIQYNQTDESGDRLSLQVLSMVRTVNRGAVFAQPPTRKSYSSFGNAAPEQFTDDNNNGRYDSATECFIDTNGNGVWDADPGNAGGGGASDVVSYTISINYPRLFPVAAILGWSPMEEISARTVLKNQPYGKQNSSEATKICPKK